MGALKSKIRSRKPAEHTVPAGAIEIGAEDAGINVTVVDSAAHDDEIVAFVAKIRPLDLIVFRGAEGVSAAITWLQNKVLGSGAVSHVEVAMNRTWCPMISAIDNDQNPNRMISWGSTMSGDLNDGVNDIETGGSSFGVQFRDMYDLVTMYLKEDGANVGICHIIDNPTERQKGESDDDFAKRSAELKKKIGGAYERLHNRTYDANPFALLGALFPKLRPLRKANEVIIGRFCAVNTWLFCSEFVAELYIATGIIHDLTDGIADGKVLNPKDVVPVDFIGFDGDDDGIVMPICEKPVWIK